MRWLDRLAQFDFSIQYTVENNVKLTDYLKRHPTKDASTEEIYEAEYVVGTTLEMLKLNHKYGQPLSVNRKPLSNDQSMIMVSMTNQKLSKGTESPKKFISDVKPKNFARERTQTNKSISSTSNPIDNTNKIDLTEMK